MKTFFYSLLFLASVCLPASVFAADQFVAFEGGGWTLNKGGAINVYVAPNEERGVARAAQDLCSGRMATHRTHERWW